MLEKRIQYLEELVRLLQDKVSSLEFKMLDIQKRAPAKKALTPSGVAVWEAYSSAFFTRYGHEPARNAKVNSMCVQLTQRLGADASVVTRFYLGLNDSQFTRLDHPLHLLVVNCESIYSMWKRGGMLTGAQARKAEATSVSVDASQKYLEDKYGKRR